MRVDHFSPNYIVYYVLCAAIFASLGYLVWCIVTKERP